MNHQIARIETFLVHYRPVRYFKFLEGPKGVPPRRPSVVVKITAENGGVGWGQSVPAHRWSYETHETVQSTIAHYLSPELLGMDPFDDEAIQAAMQRIIAPSFSTGQPICKAGIDLALFDLTGKLLGQTAAQRWKQAGRDHHPQAFTIWMAGGGIKSGLSFGATDDLGFHVAENPVHVHDLQATLLHCLGLNHEKLTFHLAGRDFRLTDVHGQVVNALLA